MKKEDKKSLNAKAPNKTLEAAFNGQLAKGFTDLRDIVLAIVNRADDVPDNLEYDIYLESFVDKFGLKSDKATLEKISREIKKYKTQPGVLTTDEDGDMGVVFPFQDIFFKKGDTYNSYFIRVTLGTKFKKLLNDRKQAKTYYNIAFTLSMKSKYAKIMFSRLMEHENRPKLEFKAKGSLSGEHFTYYEPIEKFREICGIPKSYKLSDIKNVCKTIVNEIEEYTDYKADVYYNLARLSNSKKPTTTHIAWNMLPKKDDIVGEAEYKEVLQNDQIPDQISLEDYQLLAEIQKILKCDDKEAMSVVSNGKRKGNDGSRILYICREVMKKPNIENPPAYVNGVINNEWSLSDQETAAETQFNNFNQRKYDQTFYGDLTDRMKK